MKKFIALILFLALAVIFVPWLHPATADQVKVYDNQKLVKSVIFAIGLDQYIINGQTPGVKMDVAPFEENGRTFVPVRFLGNALGVDNTNIAWDDSTQVATLAQPGFPKVQMTVGSMKLLTDGNQVNMDVTPLLQYDRTFLPARFVAEGLGYQVDWDPTNNIVICWPQGQPKPDVSAVQQYVQQAKQQQPPVSQQQSSGGVNPDGSVKGFTMGKNGGVRPVGESIRPDLDKTD